MSSSVDTAFLTTVNRMEVKPAEASISSVEFMMLPMFCSMLLCPEQSQMSPNMMSVSTMSSV